MGYPWCNAHRSEDKIFVVQHIQPPIIEYDLKGDIIIEKVVKGVFSTFELALDCLHEMLDQTHLTVDIRGCGTGRQNIVHNIMHRAITDDFNIVAIASFLNEEVVIIITEHDLDRMDK